MRTVHVGLLIAAVRFRSYLVVGKLILMGTVHVRLLIAAVLFGSYLVVGKLILREVPVFTAGFLRMVSAAVFLAAFLMITRSLRVPRPGRRDAFVLLAQALVGIFLFSVLSLYGVSLTGGIEAGVVLGLVPITVTLIAVAFLREKLSTVRLAGIVIAVAGAVGINVMSAHGHGGGGTGSTAWLGALLLVGAVVCEAVFVTFGRFLRAPLAAPVLSLVLAVLGALLLAVPAGIESGWGADLAGVSWQTWVLMIYSGAAINGVAAVLVYDSLDRVDATVVAAFLALTPVSGALLAVPLLGEDLRVHHVAGILLAVAGVYLVTREAGATPPEKVPAQSCDLDASSGGSRGVIRDACRA